MSNDSSSPPNGSMPAQLPRRRFLKAIFFGSMATAGVALAYRLGQWSRAETPAVKPQGAVAAPVSTTTPTAEVAEPTAAATPLLITEVAPQAPPPQVPADPTLGETAMPEVQPTAVVRAQRQVAKPRILTQREWGGRQPTSGFLPQTPARITLHHEGVFFDGSTPAPVYLRSVQRWSMSNRGWPDLPYHFLLDLDGHIYEGRPLDARGDTNTSYNPQGHALIALLGKYDKGEQQPNAIQITTVIALMAWLVDTYAIPLNTIKGHRDFIPVNEKGEHIDVKTREHITCPGDNLYRYLADGTIQRGVEQLLLHNAVPSIPEDRFGLHL